MLVLDNMAGEFINAATYSALIQIVEMFRTSERPCGSTNGQRVKAEVLYARNSRTVENHRGNIAAAHC
jgi:hypothetical protein